MNTSIPMSLFAIVVAGPLFAADAASPPKAQQAELRKLAGTWRVIAAEFSGKTIPPAKSGLTKLVIKDGDLLLMNGEKTVKQFRITVDPAKKPKTMDWRVASSRKADRSITLPTIYQLTGEELKLCFPLLPRKGSGIRVKLSRPAKFDTRGKPLGLLVARRGLASAEAEAALRKAVGFFRTKVSAHGGYLWRYSADLKLQEGENAAGPNTAWVQPPGTPTVGEAYLRAYELSGERFCLEAAVETARALVRGQLKSGGWDYRIEFDPKQRRRYAYRADGEQAGRRNVTTFDDDTTQSALRFLMRVDRALGFKDKSIHECAEFALQAVLKAQYPNGAWPQRYSEFPRPEDYPVRKASYPATWSRKYPKKDYRGYYTFNDNSIADIIDTLFLASEIYRDGRYRAAAEKAGDFIILAQMPDPQPAWAQQYDRDMHPAWARKFEPPAVTGGESQGVMLVLMTLYRRTGKKKYLAPIPRALTYLKKSRLPGGRLARFYELKTNRPLYFVKDTYELTYSDDNMPTHYGFKTGSKLGRIEREYKRLLKTDPSQLNPPKQKPVYRLSRSLREQAQRVADALDERGAWVEWGALRRAGRAERVISCRTFAKNVETLARFLAASRSGG